MSYPGKEGGAVTLQNQQAQRTVLQTPWGSGSLDPRAGHIAEPRFLHLHKVSSAPNGGKSCPGGSCFSPLIYV